MTTVWLQGNIEHVEIKLAANPFASGGEAQLFKIETEGYEHYVAKIYHVSKRSQLREQKLDYLLNNSPKSSHPDTHLIWPEQKIIDSQHQFIGFCMPLFDGEKLELLCLPKIPKRHRKNWADYDFEHASGLHKRLNISYKLASAMYDIHRQDCYILVDFKPDNVVINIKGAIALVDLDSIEVVKDGVTVFDAPVATPEYTPPDSYLPNNKVDPTQEDPWDRFSLAVILYKILVGLHPYAATSKAPFHKANNLYEKIEQGLFVHHPDPPAAFAVIPQQHEGFYKLPYPVQQLFIRCFVDGHHTPFARPSAQEWAKTLNEFDGTTDIIIPPLPSLNLDLMPDQLKPDKLYKTPDFKRVSTYPKLQIDQPISKVELQSNQLPIEFFDPKELRAQRFFNFTAALIIIVICTAISVLIPWQLALSAAFIAYFGINLMTYKNRKTSERKDSLNNVLNYQMNYFNELIETAEHYESKIIEGIEQLKSKAAAIAPQKLKDILENKLLLKEKIVSFNQAIDLERKKINDMKRSHKKAVRQMTQYYFDKFKSLKSIPTLDATTLEQQLKLYKRAKRLQLLDQNQLQHYDDNYAAIESLLMQHKVEEEALLYKRSERIKDIQFRCEQLHHDIVEEIEHYNSSMSDEERISIETLYQTQQQNNSALEQLAYDVERLEIPLNEQLKLCRKTKADVELYEKINLKSHMLNMIGIG